MLDLSRLVAGGMLTTVLADFGAEVIKVEQPRTGDPLRAWTKQGEPLWWKVYARGKKSITLNLADPRGQALCRRLAERADVLVESFVPGTLERWNLGPDALLALNPRLVIPRTVALFALARRHGIASRGVAFVEAVQTDLASTGRTLPINVDGAIAALLYDLGLPPHMGKIVFIIGRVAGLSAHVLEELSREAPMRFHFPFTYDGPGA